MTIVHSDSDFGVLFAMLVMFGAGIAFAIIMLLLFIRKARAAGRVTMTTLAILVALPLLVAVVTAVTPRTIVALGDSYCADIRCIGIENVEKETRGSDTTYKLHVRLFSDANTVK